MAKAERPHYAGHRARLRERFLKAGTDALADYEILELLLFGAIPRGDVKPLAKQLLKTFGSFAGVITADQQQLAKIDGVGPTTIAALKIVQAAAVHLARDQMLQRPALSSWQALLDYCQSSLGHAKREELHVLYLNRKNQIMADELKQTGTVDHTPVYPREIVARALELGATALIMVHNHPSGDPTPSQADIKMTKQVISAAEAMGITVHDHLIIARGRHASFKSMGLI